MQGNSLLQLAVCSALLCAGCSTPVDLRGEVNDAQLLEASDVVNVAYTYDFSECYRGDHELTAGGLMTAVANVKYFEPAFGGDLFAEGLAKGFVDEMDKLGITVLPPTELAKLDTMPHMGRAGGKGHAPGSQVVDLPIGQGLHTADDVVGSLCREGDFQVLFFLGASGGEAKLGCVIPFSKLKASGDRIYPVEFNH